ncbi:MAG: tetratricopeptide repeat protein [Bacteroidales bacterium]|nr:tetratricopeptide repeat protein [Bacteroidales bacterium]
MRAGITLITICWAFWQTGVIAVYAREEVIPDSLQRLLQQPVHDTGRIMFMNRLAEELAPLDPGLSHRLSDVALEESKNLKFNRGVAYAYMNQGILHRLRGMHDEAGKMYFESLRIMEEEEYRPGIAAVCKQIGIMMAAVGDFQGSLAYLNRALDFYTRHQERIMLPELYHNMGIAFENLGNSQQALSNYFKSLEISRELDDPYMIGVNYGRIGNIYYLAGDSQCLTFYRLWMSIAGTAGNLAGQCDASLSIGRYFNSIGKPDSSIHYLIFSDELAKDIDNLSLEGQVAKELSLAFEMTGDPRMALAYHKEFTSLNDSLNIMSMIREITRMEIVYQARKEDALAGLRMKKTRLVYSAISAALLIVLALIGFFYFKQRKGIRNMRLENDKLLRIRNRLDEKLHFRQHELESTIRFQLEKNELLTRFMEKLNEYLPNLITENQQRIREVVQELKTALEFQYWKDFEIRFREVHQTFYDVLDERFPGLTPGEKRLCAFLKLGMTTREIATLTRQNTSAIEAARIRLRKKLNISGTDTDLAELLNQLPSGET